MFVHKNKLKSIAFYRMVSNAEKIIARYLQFFLKRNVPR